jgi:hypothetical protein
VTLAGAIRSSREVAAEVQAGHPGRLPQAGEHVGGKRDPVHPGRREPVPLELAVGRYELIRDGDPEGAADLVRRYRDQIGELNCSRFGHELVAPYFQPAE